MDNKNLQLTWHIEDEQQRIHRLELDEEVWPDDADPETGLRTPERVAHGFWRFQVMSRVDIKDLECTIDKERFSSELARMRHLAWGQMRSWFPQPPEESANED